MNIRNIILGITAIFVLHSAPLHADVNGRVWVPGYGWAIEYEENFTCKGGWPGNRVCTWEWRQPSGGHYQSNLIKIKKTTKGTTSKILHEGTSGRNIVLKVRVNEGDMFNPGKHTTSYEVKYYTSVPE